MAIKKLIKYGAVIPSALSGNTTPENEFLLQEIEYDEKGNVLVDSQFNSYNELEERHTYLYSEKGALIEHVVEMPLDDVVERFNYERNEDGLLTAVTKFYGEEAGERTTYSYNENNLPLTIVYFDAYGEKEMTEHYSYNDQQEVVKKVVDHHADESQSKTQQYEYNEKHLLMRYVVEGDGEKTVTEYSYNTHDLEEKCIQFNSTGRKLLEITSEYDENLRLTRKATRGNYIRITTVRYDEQGRIIEELLSDENDFVISRNAFGYDDDGRVVEEVLYETDLTRAGRDTHMIMRYEYELL
ncbi:MAG: hypothetical protein ACKOX3_00945 [Bacteroidota bacterium]